MTRSVSGAVPDVYLSRRAAMGQIAGAGAVAAFMATHLGTLQATAQRNEPSIRAFDTARKKDAAMTESTAPTVVLVHGAFADSSSWNEILPGLLDKGYPVVAAANPLRGSASDGEYVASVLAGISGPIVLVGHSYGGIVISNAATGNDNVKALVYVAAFAPEVGESAVALAAQFPGSTLGDALAPSPLPGGGVDLYIRPDAFWSQFAADVPESMSRLMCATQRPVTEAALTEPSGEPAWKSIPSWFVYGAEDRNIPAAVEAFMAERAGAKDAIEVEGASHVVMISHPEVVTGVIQSAIDAIS
jgi:pimeloyl-ACP methyl ester carboxylesterase